MPNDLIGTVEAAGVLCATPRTVKRWAQRGTLAPAMKLPGATGAYLFRRRDVERFARKRAKTEAAKAAS